VAGSGAERCCYVILFDFMNEAYPRLHGNGVAHWPTRIPTFPYCTAKEGFVEAAIVSGKVEMERGVVLGGDIGRSSWASWSNMMAGKVYKGRMVSSFKAVLQPSFFAYNLLTHIYTPTFPTYFTYSLSLSFALVSSMASQLSTASYGQPYMKNSTIFAIANSECIHQCGYDNKILSTYSSFSENSAKRDAIIDDSDDDESIPDIDELLGYMKPTS
jgi:hypothetical protein